jgi:nucleoside phosphorylase
MTDSRLTWVCFAVREEAGPFRSLVRTNPRIRVLVTGMGRRNSQTTLSAALSQGNPPKLLITAGFAGGLTPDLARNTVVFSADHNPALQARLIAAGARKVRFHCAECVVTTAAEKRTLHASTGCEAVEMESQFIRALCAIEQIPAATVRVILDTADQDLPLDFDALMDAQQCIDTRKLAMHLLKSPWLIAPLLRLQRHSARAARHLGEFLEKILQP